MCFVDKEPQQICMTHWLNQGVVWVKYIEHLASSRELILCNIESAIMPDRTSCFLKSTNMTCPRETYCSLRYSRFCMFPYKSPPNTDQETKYFIYIVQPVVIARLRTVLLFVISTSIVNYKLIVVSTTVASFTVGGPSCQHIHSCITTS